MFRTSARICAHKRAARATGDDVYGLGPGAQFDEAIDNVAHREAASFEHGTRKVLPAMPGGDAIEAAARRGMPFRRHRTRQSRQKDQPF